MQRILTLGATGLAAVAIASPALAHDSDGDGKVGTSGHDHTYVACNSSQKPVQSVSPDEEPSEGNVDCDEQFRAEQEKRRLEDEKRRQEEAKLREAENQRQQQAIAREQAEADALEEQAKLCEQQPARAGCNPYGSGAVQAKPAAPKPVSYAAAQQEKVARFGNPAGVEIRPVAKRPQDAGLEDAIDVPDSDQLALIDPATRSGPRNLVWFTVVALAAISSLGYGLWRVLFLGDV